MCGLQYDRSQNTPPSNDVELAYFDRILSWRATANTSSGTAGQFAAEVAVIGAYASLTCSERIWMI